jgi:hypothetical protein
MERAAEELRDPLPGLPLPHIASGPCVSGERGHDTAFPRERELLLFEAEYED